MGTTGLEQACSLRAPLASAMACSVLCGCALAQSVNVQAGTGPVSPGPDPISPVIVEEVPDSRDIVGASYPVDYPETGQAIQRRLRPFGAGNNGAPRFTRSDTEVATWQSLPSLQEAGRFRTELSEFSSRWWFSTGRTDVGFGVGSVVLMAMPVSAGVSPDATNIGMSIAASPALSVGIRRKTSAVSTVYADATRTRSMGVNGIDSYSGKVGVEWKTAESRWSVAYSGLGMRLGSESRMTLSLRKGGLGIYMRSKF